MLQPYGAVPPSNLESKLYPNATNIPTRVPTKPINTLFDMLNTSSPETYQFMRVVVIISPACQLSLAFPNFNEVYTSRVPAFGRHKGFLLATPLASQPVGVCINR